MVKLELGDCVCTTNNRVLCRTEEGYRFQSEPCPLAKQGRTFKRAHD